ncbi:MAG: hypothetical protein WBX03_10515 [Terriglobales bacterium]|jgi:hypothetical protein
MELNDQERLIDEQLDAALKKYGAAEPRPRLENRILASLESARGKVESSIWRWWPVLLTAASMLLIGTAVLVKTHHSNPPLAVGSVPVVPAAKEVATAHGNEARVAQTSPHRREKRVVVSTRRLEQFPSPQPLSEQEELLTRYIEQFPHQAVLVARAQTQLMKQEMMERDVPVEDAVSTDSQQENP